MKNIKLKNNAYGKLKDNLFSYTRIIKSEKINMKILRVTFIMLLILVISGCGKNKINLTNAPYEPKIVVEGYIYPGQKISKIKLMRNVAIDNPINTSSIYLTPSGNNVTATINGTPLSFDPITQTYYNNQITVDFNKSYTLVVYATINGTQLHTTSTTITPQKGFSVLNNNLGDFKYGDQININFLPSPGTGFYSFSIVPDTATTENFIYDNITLRKKLDPAQVASNLNQFKFRYGSVNNLDSFSGMTYTYSISIRNILFYSSYTVVAYACDNNFKYYLLTSTNVQEVDGNFHEPIETFQGDGIGVFGSAIADTLKFTISK